MSLNEISDQDKLYLTLKGISYRFNDDYNNVVSALSLVGNSKNRRLILINDIDIVCSNIKIFLDQQFTDTDSDIILAKTIYSSLLDIKNKL